MRVGEGASSCREQRPFSHDTQMGFCASPLECSVKPPTMSGWSPLQHEKPWLAEGRGGLWAAVSVTTQITNRCLASPDSEQTNKSPFLFLILIRQGPSFFLRVTYSEGPSTWAQPQLGAPCQWLTPVPGRVRPVRLSSTTAGTPCLLNT